MLNTIQNMVQIQGWRGRIQEDRVTRKGPVRYRGISICMAFACIYPCSVQRWIGQSTKFPDENGRTYRRRLLVKSRHVADGIDDQQPSIYWRLFLEPYRLSVGLFVIKPDLVASGISEEIIDQVLQFFANRNHWYEYVFNLRSYVPMVSSFTLRSTNSWPKKKWSSYSNRYSHSSTSVGVRFLTLWIGYWWSESIPSFHDQRPKHLRHRIQRSHRKIDLRCPARSHWSRAPGYCEPGESSMSDRCLRHWRGSQWLLLQ